MSKSESWKTWLLVAALLIFAGLASAIVPLLVDQRSASREAESETPAESHPTVTTVDVSELPFIGEVLVEIPFIADNIQGQPITLAQAFGLLFGVVLISVGALGMLITVITVLFSKLVTRVYVDEDYQAAEAELSKRQKAELTDRQQVQSIAEPVDEGTHIRWSAIVFGFLVVILVWIAVLLLGIGLFGDETITIANFEISAVAFTSLIAVFITILVLFFMLRNREPEDLVSPESDRKPVNWGAIWVIVTGLLVVGLGTGLAIALGTAG